MGSENSGWACMSVKGTGVVTRKKNGNSPFAVQPLFVIWSTKRIKRTSYPFVLEYCNVHVTRKPERKQESNHNGLGKEKKKNKGFAAYSLEPQVAPLCFVKWFHAFQLSWNWSSCISLPDCMVLCKLRHMTPNVNQVMFCDFVRHFGIWRSPFIFVIELYPPLPWSYLHIVYLHWVK